MKILLVTGKLAQETIKHYAQQTAVEAELLVLKVQVAAFLSPETIAQALKGKQLAGFDLILVPGLVRGDTKTITETVGVPTFKGPRYAADLPTVLDSLSEVTLSTVMPACDMLKEKLQQKALGELRVVEENREVLLKNPWNMLIKDLAVGKDFPMRVMAEIVDAALMPIQEVQRLAKRFAGLGADIIDVGMVAGESNPALAGQLVAAVKQVVDVPVSIDTLNPQEIREAVAAGADLILSGDAGNLEAIASYAKETAVVVIPTNQSEGFFPMQVEERVCFMEDIVAKAKQIGFSKVLADLILEPSNIMYSLAAFHSFATRNLEIPLFVGVSNVTELIDADSVGVNALLAKISQELGAGILLATEESNKAHGTVYEEVLASKMMFLARKRGSVPKDLGLDLLVLKDKRNREEPYRSMLEKSVSVVWAPERTEAEVLDEKGSFRILLDREEGTIVALHYVSLGVETPDVVIKGKTAGAVYRKIVELGLASRVDHAAYLGCELAKSQIALKTGKTYIQDGALF